MEKKKVVPVWVSVVLTVLLVAGIALDIVCTISDSANLIESVQSVLPARILNMIACVMALAYCFKGYSKNAAVFFKSFCFIFCLSCMIPIYGIAVSYQGSILSGLILTMHLIAFACLSIFTFAKDIGKKKSLVMAGIVFLCYLVNLLTVNNMSFSFLIGIILYLILSIVFFIMVYAKYQDKAARGTK